MVRPADHPPVQNGRIGVLLINLGSPEAPTTAAVSTYLKEFLSDRRVVEIPPLLWQPILRGFVLTTRPRRSAHAYAQIWTEEGSPLVAITRRQAEKIQTALGGDVIVDWAMRYGQPSIGDRLAALQAAGCDRILLAPLYPQYSSATTATVFDAAAAALAKMRWQPSLRVLPPYYDDAAYIAALETSVTTGLASLSFVPDTLIASFHSLPARTLDLGDPYYCQCMKTARLLSEALGRELKISFQSRLGRAKWLEPATDVTLASLPQAGVRKIAIIAPGFAADNLETLEELAIRGRESFIDSGGTDFAYLPCLNDSAAGISMLSTLLSRELAGWRTAP
ncbi:ferrochelatase [Aquisediminimonas profunda]|uniref:ferrochelatase n=1 Tax=Aquisediminimonas profunda TaxID=1550733 RepID=UPI001C62F8C1|nr:ferrochelatase [Aquisediminimonas profunda]